MDEKKIGLIKRITPYIAIACAALSLIFTFLVGASDGTFFYKYFGAIYGNLDIVPGDLISELNSVYILKTVAYSLLSVTVLVAAGFTVYCAVARFVLKKETKFSLEKCAVYTYFAYILFAASYGAGEAWGAVSIGAATIVGVVLTSLAACAYFAATVIPRLSELKDKRGLINFIYTAVVVVLLCVTTAIATVSIAGVKTDAASYKGGFLSFVEGVMYVAKPDKFTKVQHLASAARCGYIVAVAMAAIYLLMLASNLFKPFGKDKSDSIFYGIALVGGIVELFFSTLVAAYFEEIAGLEGSVAIGFSVTLLTLSAVLFILSVFRGKIVDLIAKKFEKKVEEAKEGEVLLEVKNLCKYFSVSTDFFGRPNAFLKAVDNVSFTLKRGKTLGIVGESGCGKTTMGRTLLRLHDVTSGEVIFNGQTISDLSNSDFDKLRPQMQMIFQDPYASLSPRLTVGEIIGEAALQHGIVDKAHYHDYVLGVMKMCGLQPHYFERYPHEFSGGQRQRICIARALALKPELVVCDEPVSALDVSIQAQVINMLIDLRKSLGLTYIFISHDLSVVKHISDEVGVMYLGSMVEYGSKEAIFQNTLHPYTKALFSAVPVPNPHVKMNRIILKGDIPSPVNPPKGCKFHTRCDKCMEICSKAAPIYKEVEEGHFCACHLYNTEEETAELLKKAAEEEALAAAENGATAAETADGVAESDGNAKE